MAKSNINVEMKKKLNMKNRKNLFMLITFGCVLILISIALFMTFIFVDEEKKVSPPEPTVPITQLLTKTYNQMEQAGLTDQIDIVDNRISPYENQAVIIEVLRIRHRGLLDKLLTPGNSWKTKPEFYFITEMDGMEYISKNIEQHGQVSEVLFNTWDSMFQENKVVRTVEQEQETSEITLTVLEREKTGLLGLRSNDVTKDSFTVTFCHRTGRWTGDDFFGDSDGYGYYLGDTFEIWFNLYRPDFDNDYIPYWTEVNILGTDPTMHDSGEDYDNDEIPLSWEWKWGYDPYTWDDHIHLDPDIDSLPNKQEYQLEKHFANPNIENIYVEIDHMERGGINDPPHVFFDESVQALTERYAQHNIKAFFDNGWPGNPLNGGGQAVPHIEMLSQDSGMILQYYNNYFPDERKGSFIYCMIGHNRAGGFQHPAKGNVYDIIHIAYTPVKKIAPIEHLTGLLGYGILPTQRGVRVGVAGVLLHELGHFGGFTQDYFEGVDTVEYNTGGAFLDVLQGEEFRETWGNYKSVMNYAYTFRHNFLDYSDGSNGEPYDQDDWANFHLGGWSRTASEVEEAYYLVYGEGWEETRELLVEKDIDLIETPPITGYVYDENLTKEIEKRMGEWSPISRWNVSWAVHRLVDKEEYPDFRDVKVLISPTGIEGKYHKYWSLYTEGDFNSEGNIDFTHSIPINTLILNP